MAKLVILNQGMTGRVHDLNTALTTVGRVEDNIFQIPDPSVSSHHCAVYLRGNEVYVRDLNSTNGSYINGSKVIESVLKPGQVLRLGQVELRLEDMRPMPGAPPQAPIAPMNPTRRLDPAMSRGGVSRTDLETGGRAPGFDSAFTKKRNKIVMYFWIGAIAIGCIIVALLFFAFAKLNQ